MKTMCVLMQIRKFDFRPTNAVVKATFKMDEGTVGYLQVFDTRENAEAALGRPAGPDEILEIMESTKGGKEGRQ